MPTNGSLVKAMVFPVVMNRCESSTIKKAEHWRTDVFELWWFSSLLRIPWAARRSNQSILREISPEYSLDAEAEAPILWPPDAKNWLIGKDPDAGKDWRQEKGLTEDEMIDRHHWFNGHEFEQAPGVGDGQGSLVSCSPWGHKESDMTERLNWTELNPAKWVAASFFCRQEERDSERCRELSIFLLQSSNTNIQVLSIKSMPCRIPDWPCPDN